MSEGHNVEQPSGDGGVDASHMVQIVDAEGSVITVSVEQLAAAGIDIESMADSELSEEQMNHLLAIAGAAPTSDQHQHQHQHQPHHQHHQQDTTVAQLRDHKQDQDPGGDALTLVIAEDGSLKLNDGQGHEYTMTPDQLAANDIDINNLTDEHISRIVTLAVPTFESQRQGGGSAPKRTRLSSEQSSGFTAPSHSHNAQQTATGMPFKIGQEVEVRKRGAVLREPAVIRYCRPGGGYKVQFDDQRFEWVAEESIELRLGGGGNNRSHVDHETYGSEGAKSNGVAAVANGCGIGRRIPPTIPGIRVASSTNQATHNSMDPARKALQEFCCPVCDKMVQQKEPAYIVIRIPACDSCADRKIIVLDKESDHGNGKADTTTATTDNNTAALTAAVDTVAEPEPTEGVVDKGPSVPVADGAVDQESNSGAIIGTDNIAASTTAVVDQDQDQTQETSAENISTDNGNTVPTEPEIVAGNA